MGKRTTHPGAKGFEVINLISGAVATIRKRLRYKEVSEKLRDFCIQSLDVGGSANDDIDVEGEECKGIGGRDAAGGRVSEVWARWTRRLPARTMMINYFSLPMLCLGPDHAQAIRGWGLRFVSVRRTRGRIRVA
jgi:hypothetical protein